MNIAITGSPGTGKTILARGIAAALKMKAINEKDFALKNKIGKFNDENELEIPIKEFEKKANAFLKSHKNIIFEGHTICEMKLAVDKIIIIKINPEELESRLEKRHYSAEKIMDNVFCEGIEYCKKHALRKYNKKHIIELISLQNPRATLSSALFALSE